MVVVGKHVVFFIFACCDLVGNPHLAAEILFFAPLPRQPRLDTANRREGRWMFFCPPSASRQATVAGNPPGFLLLTLT